MKFEYHLLDKDQKHLFTHMEMATLFFCRASELYLKENGIIAFLMPISVIASASQHVNFKKFEYPVQKLLLILDFQGIRDIFSLPTCGLIAKKTQHTVYSIHIGRYHGKINKYKKNEKFNIIRPVVDENYNLPIEPPQDSYSSYYGKFKEGATLVPRNFWFVELHFLRGIYIDKVCECFNIITFPERKEGSSSSINKILVEKGCQSGSIMVQRYV
jgi:hypothetical protein